ncbi:MAG: alpha-ketoglutarate-dependent taurine dioxygenase [Halieaceae bacterium]|jgi:alpha-ketoglutarate-dependent taurine dioxygenase
MPGMSNMLAELKYSEKEFPSIIVNDGTVTSLEQATRWISDNLEALKKELACSGAILFRGFPVSNAVAYDTFFSAFDYPNFTYKESLSNAVRINHTEYVFTANEAPKEVEIYLHNEMAQTPVFPGIISLFCENAAEHGGATVLCRSDSVYDALVAADAKATQKLQKLGVKYTTLMPKDDAPETGQGRSWRGTLSVETTEQAEHKLRSLGYSWRWVDNGALEAQTAALPAIRTLESGRTVFFNQLIAAYLGWKGVKENPDSALCYGDDSSLDKGYLDQVVAIAKSLSYDLEWRDGDVAVADNNLVMHGRLPYSGERKRKVLVVLGAQ